MYYLYGRDALSKRKQFDYGIERNPHLMEDEIQYNQHPELIIKLYTMFMLKKFAILSCAVFLFSGAGYAGQPETRIGASTDATSFQLPTGTVKEASGSPIVGALVVVKGTNISATVNTDGTFYLDNVKNGDTIEISCIGYKTKEFTYNGSIINAVLEVDFQLLDEVVVVGYGAQKKVNLTGAVASVDVNKTIESRPITDIGRALQGAIPGLTITTNSGEIGGAPTI